MYDNAGQAEARSLASIDAKPPSLTERLRAEKELLESRLTEVSRVLDELDQNPDIANILDSVAQLGHLRY